MSAKTFIYGNEGQINGDLEELAHDVGFRPVEPDSTLENWRAKLISLLVAMTIWYLIEKNMTPTPSPSETSSAAAVSQTR